MRKAVLIGTLAVSLTGPVAAYAQSAAPAPTRTATTYVIEPLEWLATGVGAVIGAAWFHYWLPGNIAVVVGGLGGGFAAFLFYNTYEQYEIYVTTKPKT
jgi:hypothetical protein